MSDKCFQVSVAAIINAGLWIVGVVLIAAACGELLGHAYAIAGLALIAFGCLREVIWRIERQTKQMRGVFELGRDSMRLVGR